jgi:hypothetical protein
MVLLPGQNRRKKRPYQLCPANFMHLCRRLTIYQSQGADDELGNQSEIDRTRNIQEEIWRAIRMSGTLGELCGELPAKLGHHVVLISGELGLLEQIRIAYSLDSHSAPSVRRELNVILAPQILQNEKFILRKFGQTKTPICGERFPSPMINS